MAARQSNRPGQAQQMPASARQNEYFVPRDGIDREVITSDICRYLGNDALVRPGTYESPDGRVTQGYFITAYRNLTSAMIQDLKADSARWEQERRAASRSSGAGGTMHSSQPNGMFVRSSNSPTGSREQRGQSDYSTWKNRQQREQDFQDTYGAPGGSAMDIDYPPATNAARTPGYNIPYSGAPAPGYPAPAYAAQAAGVGAQYPPQPYPYAAQPPPTQYSPGPPAAGLPVDRYPGMPGAAPIPAPFGQDAFVHGGHFQSAGQAIPGGYVTSGPARTTPLSVSSAAASRSIYPTAGAVYPTDADPYGYGAAAGSTATAAFPNDPLYGRGTSARPGGYPGVSEAQYDEHQAAVLQAIPTSASSTPAQMAGSGPSAPRRDRDSEPRDREREREHRDHRARRPETDRDDRHAAERARHRHGHR